MTRPRVLLIDDHLVVAEGLRVLLEPHFDVVGILSEGRDLLQAVEASDPDVVVLDISMPGPNGIDAARALRAANARAKVVFLTMHREDTYAERAMEAGASGFVLKHSAPTELVTAIDEVLKGGTYITPQVAGSLVGPSRGSVGGSVKRLSELTARQREVLRLVAEGHSAKEIAAALRISRRTAEFHRTRLMKTLGVRSTAELVQYAIRAGVTSV
jgi:DNA-binding NarL/FixJ family response regulator